MATIVNDADVALQATSPRLVSVTLPTNLIIPAIKAIKLSAPGYTFGVSSAGANPASILLTAALVQVTGTISFSVISGTATLSSVTSTTATLLYSNMTTSTVTIRAQVTESGITYTSDVSIAKVVDGASAVTAYLAQAQNLAAPAVSPNPTTGSAVPSGWSATLVSPTAGQSLWTIDGTYVATTNQTTWSAPYLTQGVQTTIQSDNFVAGVSGWRIKRDTGDVEFGSGTFRGNISGSANIDITGTANFGGATTVGGATYAGAFNTAYGATHGLLALTHTGRAVYGQTDTSILGAGIGVHGDANSGTAVLGTAGNGIAGEFRSLSGTALSITGMVAFVQAATTGTATATLLSNKPGANSNFTWIPATVGGVAGRIPFAPD